MKKVTVTRAAKKLQSCETDNPDNAAFLSKLQFLCNTIPQNNQVISVMNEQKSELFAYLREH